MQGSLSDMKREKLELEVEERQREREREEKKRGDETCGQTFSKAAQILWRDCCISSRGVSGTADPGGSNPEGKIGMSVVRPAGMTQRRKTERYDDSMARECRVGKSEE